MFIQLIKRAKIVMGDVRPNFSRPSFSEKNL